MRYSALIMNADCGLGPDLTEALLEQNMIVFAGCGRKPDSGLESLAARYPGKLLLARLDDSRDDGIQMVSRILKAHTPYLDVLIHNATCVSDRPFPAADPSDFEAVRQASAGDPGIFRLTDELMPLLLRSRRKLVVHLSAAPPELESSSEEHWYTYCMARAKANVHAAMIHQELRSRGGQVLSIHPEQVEAYMQGTMDFSGKISFKPFNPAAAIARLIVHDLPLSEDQPAFLDNTGRRMAW